MIEVKAILTIRVRIYYSSDENERKIIETSAASSADISIYGRARCLMDSITVSSLSHVIECHTSQGVQRLNDSKANHLLIVTSDAF